MVRTPFNLLIIVGLLLTCKLSPATAMPLSRSRAEWWLPASDSPGVTASCATKARIILSPYQGNGLFRDGDAKITAVGLSGQVFNLKSVALFNGTYHKVEADSSDTGGGSRATMKNLNGVTVNLVPTIEGRKFILGRDGMTIKLDKAETLK